MGVDGEIGYDDENIIVRGHKIKGSEGARSAAPLPWKNLGVDVVLESTGFFTARDKAELPLTKRRRETGADLGAGEKP